MIKRNRFGPKYKNAPTGNGSSWNASSRGAIFLDDLTLSTQKYMRCRVGTRNQTVIIMMQLVIYILMIKFWGP